MNNFYKYLQPTIIQATMNEELPEKVRGRYFINFNVFGIQYFVQNYILGETTFGAPYLILKEDNWGLLLEDTTEGELLDIPRLYIDITDAFVNDKDNVFQSFITQALVDHRIWVKGIDGFMATEQYYTNYTLYNYLALTDQIEVPDFSVRLPNYLDEYGFIQTQYWYDLSGEVFKDYNNLDYFNEKNNLLSELTYTDDELNNFYSTFCKIILENTRIPDDLKLTPQNQIYELVLNYFKGFKSDCGSNAIAMILNSGYSAVTKNNTNGCGCNSMSSSTEIVSSCSDLYAEAMNTWLAKMLGDWEFYNDWFTITMSEDEKIPNDVLIEKLQKFFSDFLALQHTLTFLKPTYIKCDCPAPVSFNENECNYNIINNYRKIFGWVFDEALEANVNKIKIYGKQFAELLPNLQF